jgi:Ni/Co efflux regulator RcnB
MRKLWLAGIAGIMLAGPALAQEQQVWQGDRDRGSVQQGRDGWQGDRAYDGRRDDRAYDRRDDRRDDRAYDRRDDRRDVRIYDRRDDRRDDRGYDRRDDRGGWQQGRSDWRWSGTRYRGPSYVYPRGYGYQPWGVGYRLPPAYFGNRYWIGNPGHYRLPRAHYGTRWVRVGPDALLIRIGNGIVIQAVRGLYW